MAGAPSAGIGGIESLLFVLAPNIRPMRDEITTPEIDPGASVGYAECMSEPIREFAQLSEQLSRLEPPREGHARVFRGQTGEFGAMLASGLRPGAPQRKHLWAAALRSLAANVGASGDLGHGIELIEAMGYWFDVLAQHYGPGSTYLDVTWDPQVAIWFALNQGRETAKVRLRLAQGDVSFPLEFPRLCFSSHKDEPGWFYVFDVPFWDEQGPPAHGDLVDLAIAPDYIANAPRVQRQHGCLIAGEGDVSGFYACDPIAIAHPLQGAGILERDSSFLFPAPDEDEWYERLLRAPLVPQLDEQESVAYEQSLGVYFIVPDESREHTDPFIERQTRYLQPLTRLTLRADPRTGELEEIMGASAEEATYIQLESPLMRTLPPPENWNESLLLEGLRQSAPVVETTGGDSLDAMSLENVLIEFSPLEWSFRESPEDVGYSEVQWRGIWIVRNGDNFARALLATIGTERGFLLGQVHHSEATGAFIVTEPDGTHFAQSEHASAAPLFTALYVLRDLSRSIKPDAYPRLVRGGHTGILDVRGQSAKLVRSDDDPLGLNLHFLRYINSGASYEGPSPARSLLTELLVDVSTPFTELRGLEQVYGRVREAQLGPGKIAHLPPPDESGHSEGAVSQLLSWFPRDLGG